MGYYQAEPGMTVRDFSERWMKGDKAYDGSMPIQMLLSDIWKHREYDWNRENSRAGRGWLYQSAEDRGQTQGAEKWDDLVQSMEKYGWSDKEPVHLNVDKKGNAKVGEGNHRLVIAKQLNINTVPVIVHFVSEVWSSGRSVKSALESFSFKSWID